MVLLLIAFIDTREDTNNLKQKDVKMKQPSFTKKW